MRDMRGRLVTTWLVSLSVLVFLLATLFVMHANTVTARHCHDTPVSICEHIHCHDLDGMRVESVTPSTIVAVQHPLTIPLGAITPLQLSPNIFQPPEAA
jgi:hypothetical protein